MRCEGIVSLIVSLDKLYLSDQIVTLEAKLTHKKRNGLLLIYTSDFPSNEWKLKRHFFTISLASTIIVVNQIGIFQGALGSFAWYKYIL